MATTTINVQALTADQRLHLPPSPALSRFGEILTARHQPWCEYLGNDKDKLRQKPYTEADVVAAIDNLEDYELSRGLVGAAFHGDLKLAQQLWDRRGPFETVHVKAQYQEIINGTAVRQSTGAQHKLTNAETINEVRQLMEWLPSVGLGFMVGVGSKHSLLLESAYLDAPIKHLARPSAFTGELPVLSQGVITNPELLIALRDKQAASSIPEAYSDILCWVPAAQVDEFPDHLKPFKVQQGLHLVRPKTPEEGTGFHRQEFSFSECTEKLFSQVERRSIINASTAMQPATWDFNILEMRIEPAAGLSGYPSEMVLTYQATEAIKHGFDHKPGHVLCHTSVEFLSGFPVSSVDPERSKAASAFAKDYFPIDLLSLSREGTANFDASCIGKRTGFALGSGKGHSNIRDLYYAFGDDSPIRDQVRSLPRPIIDFMIGMNPLANLDCRSMLALKQGLGIDNTKFGAQLNSVDLQKLHDGGYRFADASVTRLPQRHTSTGKTLTYERMSSEDTEVYMYLAGEAAKTAGTPEDEVKTQELHTAYQNALRMNLWPSEMPRPEDLRKAIIQAAAKKKPGYLNHDRALRALFDLEGIENCIKATDSASQVDFLRRHFGHNEVQPFLNLTTRKIRGRLVEDDLGL